MLSRISTALANNQPLDQVLSSFNEPQRGGFLNRLLNPGAISGTPTQLEQQLLGSMLTQRMADPQGLGQQQKQATLDLTKARTAAAQAPKTVSASEQISQKKLSAIQDLEKKIEAATATEADKTQLESAIGLKIGKTPQEDLAFWTRVLDVSARPTLNPDGSLNTNPLPNVSSEAREQIKAATDKIRGNRPQRQGPSAPPGVSFPGLGGARASVSATPSAPVAPVPGAVTQGRVKVKDKNGNIGTIPASQLQDALREGFTRVR